MDHLSRFSPSLKSPSQSDLEFYLRNTWVSSETLGTCSVFLYFSILSYGIPSTKDAIHLFFGLRKLILSNPTKYHLLSLSRRTVSFLSFSKALGYCSVEGIWKKKIWLTENRIILGKNLPLFRKRSWSSPNMQSNSERPGNKWPTCCAWEISRSLQWAERGLGKTAE